MNRESKIAIWAWVASVVFHIMVFRGFSFVHFSRTSSVSAQSSGLSPVTAQIKRLIDSSPVSPKPKVAPKFPQRQPLRATRKPFLADSVGKLNLHDPGETVFRPADAAEAAIPQDVSGLSDGTVFFGQFTSFRKICYVVDWSGSMYGRLGLVKDQLTRSIQALMPDQFFYIIFFRNGDELLESGGGKMQRAAPGAKAQAARFIESINPSGQSNAINALQRAMQIRDSLGNCPEQIYFLTDGFDLQDGGSEQFAGRIENMRKNLAPTARINTIVFWDERTERADVEILKSIAEQSGGQFSGVE